MEVTKTINNIFNFSLKHLNSYFFIFHQFCPFISRNISYINFSISFMLLAVCLRFMESWSYILFTIWNRLIILIVSLVEETNPQCQSVSQSINQSVSQSVSQKNSQSVNLSIRHRQTVGHSDQKKPK